jgi:hypothetical protein
LKVEWTADRSTLALLVPRRFREAIHKIYDIADRRDNGYINITISNVHKPRSTGWKSQNHAINGYIQLIATETGEDFGVIKMYCKRRALSRGYPLMEREGKLVYSKVTGEVLPESEANLSTVEAGYLIDEIQQLASELGINLGDGHA